MDLLKSLRDVARLGQVFTPQTVVSAMLALRRNGGRVLEPSCGDGAFSRHLPGCVALEVDPSQAPPGAQVLDFFAYPTTEKFSSIMGNPPYVRHQDIGAQTLALLKQGGWMRGLDRRANLYLFFIDKCLAHLAPGGELIFITPRDFLKSTSAMGLNQRLYDLGSMTDVIALGDMRIFQGADPNCLIWRFEAGNFSRRLRYAELGFGDNLARSLDDPPWQERHFVASDGHLLFTRGDYPLRLADLCSVKVGGVSGADDLFASDVYGNRDFVCSTTAVSGATRRMIWTEPHEEPPAVLLPHKARLLARRVRSFDEHSWWLWGRRHPVSTAPRIYVNGRTRQARPFFLHDCPHFDGAILALFPKRADVDLGALRDALNDVDWGDLGFVCDGRYIFNQRSLENTPLPECFRAFL